MIVMKFGGTSVQDAASVARAAAIVDQLGDVPPLVVVSAVGGITRRLLRLGEDAAGGAAIAGELDAIEALHRGILHGVAPRSGGARRALDEQAVQLRDLAAKIAEQADYPPASQDALISCGERFSAVIFSAAARGAGLPAERVDAATLVVTDDRFRRARPDRTAITRRSRELLLPLLESRIIPIIEGFIGATPAGEPTTMGFEASDLTATLLGAALDAAGVQIWTDVPGMLTTGHPAVAQPLVVPRLSFDEAAELALFGAKVLHPDTISPARERGIPVRILHSRNPGGEGTWIAQDGAAEGPPRVKSIAVTEDPDDESFEAVRATLGADAPGEWRGRAVICPVGQGIGSNAELAERISRLVSEITASLPLPPRPHAIPLVIPRSKVGAVIRRLHDVLVS